MTLNEILTITAILLGPIISVVIALWHQSRSEHRVGKLHVFNSIWDTHHDASNPLYSSAIRSVPIVFKKNKRVRQAWELYMANVQSTPSIENSQKHNQDFLDKKHDLIANIAKSVGLRLTEREIRNSVYQAQAYSSALNNSQQAQLALPRIAEALEKQANKCPK